MQKNRGANNTKNRCANTKNRCANTKNRCIFPTLRTDVFSIPRTDVFTAM